MFLESMNNRLESKIQRLQGNASESEKLKEGSSRTLISDEHLDRHIEEIIDSKKTKVNIIRKKSFLARLFSR